MHNDQGGGQSWQSEGGSHGHQLCGHNISEEVTEPGSGGTKGKGPGDTHGQLPYYSHGRLTKIS